MRTQIKHMHGRTMKSSKTNFVTTSQNRSKFGAAEMKAHNAAFASAKRTQHDKMNKMHKKAQTAYAYANLNDNRQGIPWHYAKMFA